MAGSGREAPVERRLCSILRPFWLQLEYALAVVPPFPFQGFQMNISMYQASVPRFVNILGNLSNILDKAQAHVDAKKLDAAVLPNYRLFPDMLPMTTQVQIACDAAKGVVARLAGVEIPVYEDNEKTLADLKARVAKTIAFIKSVNQGQIDGTEDKEIVIKRGDKETRYNGMQFLLGHAVPNFYFHVTTTYNTLRHTGLKSDNPSPRATPDPPAPRRIVHIAGSTMLTIWGRSN